MLKLYSYFRSSASYRVRIALHLKHLAFEYVPVHLVRDGGQQNQAEYRRINPMGHVPALDHDGFLVAESVAIIQYLDDQFPAPPRLFPQDARARARVLQICEILNSGIQPLQNLKVTRALENEFSLSKDDCDRWVKKWISAGFASLESVLGSSAGAYCHGDEVSAADCFLVPQCFSARRFGVRVEDYPTIAAVEASAQKLEAVRKAHPERQPDFA
jgi:maleylacetoacetate isomerase